uniref:Uncharacterized protein n=1 Tax=Chromera velia CCMP2878 TaxID=1169474 RepID=A0A0G4H5K2_9ALVE|mmetsp:Transcript_28162/g.55143  ORF Transcript_28162/g.55143 Transcript_28162/m.55143 type:complete len:318 (+) Transcript_28162:120-1073(+)|eukprot:Cvel_24777.t1-p1 / transcript=Cvel_24777.t1 / gene=Cvel_24777 / organism=Chromera_velia_CCMP2878 / gene_product=hypothetical protein / transcript_product=hypothetical protein / location=Cvel_scaffold2725:1480-2430(-) / protein_length=317 / sequence_SO=supercontig / SO=protein_coding / is_pseudo=false
MPSLSWLSLFLFGLASHALGGSPEEELVVSMYRDFETVQSAFTHIVKGIHYDAPASPLRRLQVTAAECASAVPDELPFTCDFTAAGVCTPTPKEGANATFVSVLLEPIRTCALAHDDCASTDGCQIEDGDCTLSRDASIDLTNALMTHFFDDARCGEYGAFTRTFVAEVMECAKNSTSGNSTFFQRTAHVENCDALSPGNAFAMMQTHAPNMLTALLTSAQQGMEFNMTAYVQETFPDCPGINYIGASNNEECPMTDEQSCKCATPVGMCRWEKLRGTCSTTFLQRFREMENDEFSASMVAVQDCINVPDRVACETR